MASSSSSPCSFEPLSSSSVPQHDIFLSHSGAQKPFVTTLYQQLRMCYSTFFDITPHSLPLGEDFPSHIFHAARTCRLAVVVLSHEYLQSKWPMLELCAFVEAKPPPQIMPLFFTLSPKDLQQKQNQEVWRRAWAEFAKEDSRIDVSKWGSALKELRKRNGIPLDLSDGESACIDKVFSRICENLPPSMRHDFLDFPGIHRMSQDILAQFEKLDINGSKACVLGMYGLPGSGKSTLCRYLCDHLFLQFTGKVLYLELPTDADDENLLVKSKVLLNQFTNYKNKMDLSSVSHLGQVCHLLRGSDFSNSRVFLVVDNISSENSQNFVITILGLGLAAGSKVLLVARSRSILCRPHLSSHYDYGCMSVPSLNKEEALRVLLQSRGGVGLADASALEAALTPRHRQIMEEVLSMSSFGKEKDYLPLVLRIMGEQLRQHEPDLEDLKRMMTTGVGMYKEKALKELVLRSFKALPQKLQTLFLDAALFIIPLSYLDGESDMVGEAFLHLSLIQGCKREEIECEMRELQKHGFLTIWESKYLTPTISVDDVYLEFAASIEEASQYYWSSGLRWSNVQRNQSIEVARNTDLGLRTVVLELEEGREEFEFSPRFSRVKAMVLRNCESLKILWGFAMSTSLASLEIHNCPSLKWVEPPATGCEGPYLQRVRWSNKEEKGCRVQQQDRWKAVSMSLKPLWKAFQEFILRMGYIERVSASMGFLQKAANHLLVRNANSRARKFHDFDESGTDHGSFHNGRRHLWPKIHAIYSKNDKDFVWYLQEELRKMCYDVLDDAESNLSGQDPTRGSCLVVVVLSESFLKTEACMADFMSLTDDMNWLCLFYELSIEEFLKWSFAKWRDVWDSRQGIEVYHEASWYSRLEGRALDCSEGNTIEVMKMVTRTISSSFIPLQVYWSKQASHIQGRIRLCQKVDKCLFEGPLCDEDVRVLGLHGMWSLGKTSLAKVLCEFYYTEFQGRVYHAELLERKSHLQLVKHLLRNLLGAEPWFLEQHLTDLAQAYAYLDHCFKQSSEKVFLVVDNIQESWECLERARDLFLRRVPFPKGSMVVCFARSPHTLEQLLLPLDKRYCIESMPSLNLTEGYQIFLEVLFSNLSGREAMQWENVNRALEFSSVLGVCLDQQPHRVENIHPLRFKSLAHFFREKDAGYWLSAFAKKSADAVFKDIQDLGKWKEKTMFKALYEIYNSLDQHVQQFFIDIALYVPKGDLSWLGWLDNDRDDFFSSGFECLQKLQAVSLLTIEERRIKMCSVCRKFAEKIARNSEALVYMVEETIGMDVVIEQFVRADIIERISFKNCTFNNGDTLEPFILDLSNCKRLQVLRLLNVKCKHMLQVLLGHSKLLTLEISSNLAPVVVDGDLSCVKCFSCRLGRIASSKLNSALNFGNLEALEMHMIDADDLECLSKRCLSNVNTEQIDGNITLEHFQSTCELETLWLSGNVCDYLSGGLDLCFWPALRELTLFHVSGLESLWGFRNLHNLRALHIQSLRDLKLLHETESLSMLQELHIIECQKLSELQLPAGKRLTHCCIWFCSSLNKIDVCGSLPANLDAPLITLDEDQGSRETICDHEVDEFRRYFLSSDQDHENMTCSDPGNHAQFVHFSSENKLSVEGCKNLLVVDGLAKLTSIQSFGGTELAKLLLSVLNSWDWKVANFRSVQFLLPGLPSPVLTSKLILTNVVLGTLMNKLELHDVQERGFIQRLTEALQCATSLKFLIVRCKISGSNLCGCDQFNPNLHLLPRSLLELTYQCPQVNPKRPMKCTLILKGPAPFLELKIGDILISRKYLKTNAYTLLDKCKMEESYETVLKLFLENDC